MVTVLAHTLKAQRRKKLEKDERTLSPGGSRPSVDSLCLRHNQRHPSHMMHPGQAKGRSADL